MYGPFPASAPGAVGEGVGLGDEDGDPTPSAPDRSDRVTATTATTAARPSVAMSATTFQIDRLRSSFMSFGRPKVDPDVDRLDARIGFHVPLDLVEDALYVELGVGDH